MKFPFSAHTRSLFAKLTVLAKPTLLAKPASLGALAAVPIVAVAVALAVVLAFVLAFVLSVALLALVVGGRGAAHRACQIVC